MQRTSDKSKENEDNGTTTSCLYPRVFKPGTPKRGSPTTPKTKSILENSHRKPVEGELRCTSKSSPDLATMYLGDKESSCSPRVSRTKSTRKRVNQKKKVNRKHYKNESPSPAQEEVLSQARARRGTDAFYKLMSTGALDMIAKSGHTPNSSQEDISSLLTSSDSGVSIGNRVEPLPSPKFSSSLSPSIGLNIGSSSPLSSSSPISSSFSPIMALPHGNLLSSPGPSVSRRKPPPPPSKSNSGIKSAPLSEAFVIGMGILLAQTEKREKKFLIKYILDAMFDSSSFAFHDRKIRTKWNSTSSHLFKHCFRGTDCVIWLMNHFDINSFNLLNRNFSDESSADADEDESADVDVFSEDDEDKEKEKEKDSKSEENSEKSQEIKLTCKNEAIFLAERMLRVGLIENVPHSNKRFTNSKNLYRRVDLDLHQFELKKNVNNSVNDINGNNIGNSSGLQRIFFLLWRDTNEIFQKSMENSSLHLDFARLARRFKVFIFNGDLEKSFIPDDVDVDQENSKLMCIKNILEFLSDGLDVSLDEKNKIKNDLDFYVKSDSDLLDPTGLQKFLMTSLGEKSKINKVLKATTQSIVAPAIVQLKRGMDCEFNTKRSGWNVEITIKQEKIIVIHRKCEVASPIAEEKYGHFEFEWAEELVFDTNVEQLMLVTPVLLNVTGDKKFKKVLKKAWSLWN